MSKIPDDIENKPVLEPVCIKRLMQAVMEMRPYYGCILQSIEIRLTHSMNETAYIGYNKENHTVFISLCESYLSKLTLKQQVMVVLHELFHLQLGHIFWNVKEDERGKWNIAMDLVINQMLDEIPYGGLDYKKFTGKNGKPLPPDLTEEQYFDLIKDEDAKKYSDYHTQHGKISDVDMMNGIARTIRQAIDKATYLPSNEKNRLSRDIERASHDLIKIEAKIKKLNYRELLAYAVRSAISHKIDKTWSKPSRRYGHLARGNKLREEVRICFYIDTSGSMSHEDINECRTFIEELVKYTKTEFYMAFFHSSLYQTPKRVNKKEKMSFDKIQSGGTDLTDVMKSIAKENHDLSIILTDGCYDDVKINIGNKKVIFVISKNGVKKHSLARYGKTVVMS